MKPCIVGIGGAGGNILKQFLQRQDMDLVVYQFGEHLAYGEVKGLWLESARMDVQNQNYYRNLLQGGYPPYLVCHEIIGEGSPVRRYVMDTYGFDLKAPGFDRRAEYLKGIFEVFEFDPSLKARCSEEFKGYKNPLSEYIWKVGIRPFTIISTSKHGEIPSPSDANARDNVQGGVIKSRKVLKHCDSILFLASLGGGTGTGFINPITSYVRSEESIFPIFAMGILTEKGTDARHTPEGQRDLGAVIAMYDLLTKESGKGIDSLILVDNEVLIKRFGGNYSSMDGHIFKAMKPLLDHRNYPHDKDLLPDDPLSIKRIFWEGVSRVEVQGLSDRSKVLLPPILVPCYYSQPDYRGDETDLVDGALGRSDRLDALGEDGRLFPCDPTKADKALVFTRGIFGRKDISEAVQERTGLTEDNIKIYRRLGDSRTDDMLVLLRNPYGGTPGEHLRLGTLEWRLHGIVSESIKYIENSETNILGFLAYKDVTKDKLRDYFYGKNGLREELNNSLTRLETGERPVFSRPLGIFGDGTIKTGAPESSAGSQEIVLDRNNLRDLVKAELKEILRSEDGRRIINDLLT